MNAEELAVHNYKINSKLYTILFFDEANTTENIGLIKEVMCDRQLNGRQIHNHVKFIAACNPYKKLVVWIIMCNVLWSTISLIVVVLYRSYQQEKLWLP